MSILCTTATATMMNMTNIMTKKCYNTSRKLMVIIATKMRSIGMHMTSMDFISMMMMNMMLKNTSSF